MGIQKNYGVRKNLMEQLDSLFTQTNEKSYGTRRRYQDGMRRFLNFAADEFHLQAIKNVKSKHIRAYVEYMQEKDMKPTTILTELTSIRFWHARSGSKNKLVENKDLDLEKRHLGEINCAWMNSEYKRAYAEAVRLKRDDVAFGMEFSYRFGLRVHEVAKIRVEHLKKAIETDELYTKGKGGKERWIPIDTAEQRILIVRALASAEKRSLKDGNYFISDNEKGGVESKIESLMNWVRNHRSKFAVSDRGKLYRKGYKPYSENITWHGLRYSYAQWVERYYRKKGYTDVDKRVIRNLGHERADMTKRYLAKTETKTKKGAKV